MEWLTKEEKVVRTLLLSEFDDEERPVAFAKVQHHLSDKVYWLVLGEVYRSCSIFYGMNHFIGTLFHADRKDKELLVGADDVQTYSTLPKVLRVYRGCWSANDTGWNYTLNRADAERFAREAPFDGQPLLISARCHKNDVELAYSRKGVLTIVIDPRKLKVTSVKKLPFRKEKEQLRVGELLMMGAGQYDPEWQRLQFLMPVISVLLSVAKQGADPDLIHQTAQLFSIRAERLQTFGFDAHAEKVLNQRSLMLNPTEEVEKWVKHFLARCDLGDV